MSSIQQGLLITAIGMGLVFAVIIFLWGLMALMMKVTSNEKKFDRQNTPIEEIDVPLVPEMQVAEGQRRAAAAAVAVEAAIAASFIRHSKTREGNRMGGLSPWQVVHRLRQLQQKNSRG